MLYCKPKVIKIAKLPKLPKEKNEKDIWSFLRIVNKKLYFKSDFL